ncbi:hypothetical protein ACP4OV_007761 [Aristida adscensionis]
MLLARAAPPQPPAAALSASAASSPAIPERVFRPRRVASSRAAVAMAAAPRAAPSRGGQKRKQVASVANPLVKHCVKLRLSAAYRRSCRRLLLVGLAPVLEVCRFEFSTIEYLLLLDGVEAPEELQEVSGDVVYVSAAVMKKVSGMQSVDSTEAIAVMHMPKHFRDLGSHEDGADLDGLFDSPSRILVLDGIQDPGNLGTLIRSACAFKWDGVFLLPACCDPFNEKAIRAARGASLQIPIVSGTWHDLHVLMSKYDMKMMAGHPESSSDGSKGTHSLSKELADSLVNESLCLVLGSEGNGLSAETIQACELVSIPMEGPRLWRSEAPAGVLVGAASLSPSSPPPRSRAARDTRARASELQEAPRHPGVVVATHKVTVHDRQRGVVHEFVVPEDQYILHTAEAQDITLPFACRHGCCTSCAVRIKSGQIRQPEALGISAELKDKGYALLCVGFPTCDVEVETQDEDEVYWLQFGRYFARGPVERDDYALELAMGDE